MKPRKMTEKARDKWNAEFKRLGEEALLAFPGAVHAAGMFKDFVVQTQYGPLGINVCDFFACAFENKSLFGPASAIIGCNPHSGKWNHHFLPREEWKPAEAVAKAMFRLKCICQCERCSDSPGELRFRKEWLCAECKVALAKEPPLGPVGLAAMAVLDSFGFEK